MSDKKGSSLDIFDSLTKKKESGMPSDSGVVAKSVPGGSKAPPPPPSISRAPRPPSSGPSAPTPPPSLAQLAAPVGRPSAAPPPPPSSLRPQSAPTPAPPPPSAGTPPPPPPSLRQPSAPPPPPRPSMPPARNSAPPPPSGPSLAPPLPKPPPVPSSLNAYGGDPEDDAPTRVYSGDAGSQPPPPMKTMPRNERPMQPTAPAIHAARTQPNKAALFPKRGGLNQTYVAAGALAVLVAAALYFFVGARTGALTITVSGPGGKPLDGVQVFVDGQKRCDASPCSVASLPGGAHLVRASAKGYQDTADQAVSVVAGEQSTSNLSLAVAGAGTGVRVSALGSGLRLYVDGQEIGELPQTAKNLAPGEHTIRVAGSDRYEPYEEKVILDDGEMKSMGPLKLKVKKGLATFKPGPGADGARVLLDGRLVPELPATIEVPAGKQLTLLATKSGYSTYRRNVNFDDGIAEKTFEITMAEGVEDAPLSSSAPEETAPHGPAIASRGPTNAPRPQAAPPPPSRVAQAGKAVLNMNSIPVSNVILNGRPLGATPKVGIQVAPGPQTVVFVHPTMGRKVMTATVGAGETKTFMAKLQ
ncbi:MAG TPA: carboxypeptidase regulatory-like domain-containing protein [Polyangiaceae bacterium]|nr:carboxypeptidase regulatory-like domain-containing protein [Polyangiaceae bacterium]